MDDNQLRQILISDVFTDKQTFDKVMILFDKKVLLLREVRELLLNKREVE